jgi:8-oxo-dGTP diphosphatase
VIDVVGAVIVRDREILCVQRGQGGNLPGMWEFPGGKIEAGEAGAGALAREIDEELRCRVEVGDRIISTTYSYDFGTVRLTTFFCQLVQGQPILTEHAALRWLAPEDLSDLEWAPADLPAVAQVQKDLAQRR